MCKKTLADAIYELEYATSTLMATADGTLQLLDDAQEHFADESRYYAFRALVQQMQATATRAADAAENVSDILRDHRQDTRYW